MELFGVLKIIFPRETLWDEDFFHCILSTEISTQVVGDAELYYGTTGKGLELMGKKPGYFIYGKI